MAPVLAERKSLVFSGSEACPAKVCASQNGA
jgi:hypothetical protein